ncbi:hypothetical protein GH714_019037 [Hevea brasiliensis]|uniref:Uncharacterized protein n=1 Tax=Hevea brasiliensis TaxID=3981 RepID=A0A6A6MG87_HEVBR|nr:hypothetical protein GH714_019037 [Hevea brasiliensis]
MKKALMPIRTLLSMTIDDFLDKMENELCAFMANTPCHNWNWNQVTMQAQKVAPPDLLCKDKFLIQSTYVPFGTTDEDVTSGMFSKESGKYIDEKKLRVVLISPLHSPVLLPNNGELKKDPSYDAALHKDIAQNGIENILHLKGCFMLLEEDVAGSPAKDIEELKAAKDAESRQADDKMNLESAKELVEPKLIKDFEELKSKLHLLDSKLREADHTITKLIDERSAAIERRIFSSMK